MNLSPRLEGIWSILLLLPSPTFTAQRQGFWFPHVYMVRIHGKVGSIICFSPALPCDIVLRFFSCMVVDHNYSKSCEATLSYQSSLRGTWLRHYISSDLWGYCNSFHCNFHMKQKSWGLQLDFIRTLMCVHMCARGWWLEVKTAVNALVASHFPLCRCPILLCQFRKSYFHYFASFTLINLAKINEENTHKVNYPWQALVFRDLLKI